jgi:hypothetical protein
VGFWSPKCGNDPIVYVLHVLSLSSSYDDCDGDATEGPFWACVFRWREPMTVEDICDILGDMKDDPYFEDCDISDFVEVMRGLVGAVGAILVEDSDGFVQAEVYHSTKMLERDWAELQNELKAFYACDE